MPTPRDSLKHTIAKWEGLFQAYTWDPGNYVTMPNGTSRLVGTMRGVTPAVLAAHRGLRPWEVTEAIMQSVTLDEAAEIGEMRFYRGTGLDLLPWGPATDVLVDIGWGSGPKQAILFAQRLAGEHDDGVVGPLTVAAYTRWVASVGWEQAVREVHRIRMDFYRLLGRQNPAKYGPPQPGWKNRADWMLPESAEWWAPWQADMPQLPMPPAELPRPLPAEETAPAPTPAPPAGVGLDKAIAAGTALMPAAAPFLTADWRVLAIIAGAVLGGILIWRLSTGHKRTA